ncbi:MAG: hypothetical protein RR651_01700 [Lysinibacillus sp.]
MTTELNKHEPLKPIIVPSYSEEKKEDKTIFNKIPFLNKKKIKSVRVEKKEHMLRNTPMILPFLEIHDDYITMKEGVMDILQITPKDLYSLNEEDMQARFYRSYAADFKEVALNFPSNTEKQKQYWIRKKEKTTDPLRLRFIERKLFELKFLENERTNREFFIFLYAKSPQLLEEEKNQVIRGMRQSFPLETLSIDKKQDVLFMLNNQNSKL